MQEERGEGACEDTAAREGDERRTAFTHAFDEGRGAQSGLTERGYNRERLRDVATRAVDAYRDRVVSDCFRRTDEVADISVGDCIGSDRSANVQFGPHAPLAPARGRGE